MNYEERCTLANRLAQWCCDNTRSWDEEKSSKYNPYSAHWGIVEKTFNNGNGSLALYRFGTGNRVTANTLLEKPSDRRRLLRLMPEAEVIEDTLGYPDYYRRGLKDPDS